MAKALTAFDQIEFRGILSERAAGREIARIRICISNRVLIACVVTQIVVTAIVVAVVGEAVRKLDSGIEIFGVSVST